MAENKNAYVCREGDKSDFQELVEFLIRHDYAPKHLKWSRADYLDWLKWKYVDNPDGPARIFIVEDSNDTIAGFRASLPRRYASAETGTFMAYQGVDVLIDAGLRKKGLYTQLRQFANPKIEYRLSFPNRPILKVSLRFGDQIIGPAHKWWFPVTAKKAVERQRGIIAPIADMFFRFYAFLWLGRCPTELQMRPVKRFAEDIDINARFIHGIRSARYLNWRFIDNPMYSYSAYEFLEGDECIGYCVYSVVRTTVEISDFVVTGRHRGCLGLLVDHCRSHGITRLRFRGIGLRLLKFGFIRRRDVMSNCNASSDAPQGHWVLTMADRDY